MLIDIHRSRGRGCTTSVDRSLASQHVTLDAVSDPCVVTCEAAELRRFASAVLCSLGMGAGDARFMADVIVGSDLAGHESHGMRRLAEYVQRWRDGKVVADASPTIDLDTGAVARLDGGSGFGHLVMRDATDLAVARAKQWGIAPIAVRRSSHAGRFADFCEHAADQGVAILFFVVDMSTSVVAAGRVAEWRDRGEPIPAGWVNETGALRPVGGFKGFGLALVAEALAGALTGAGTVTADPVHDDQGVLVIALDIARLRPLVERGFGIAVAPVSPGPSTRVISRISFRVQGGQFARSLELASRIGRQSPLVNELRLHLVAQR